MYGEQRGKIATISFRGEANGVGVSELVLTGRASINGQGTPSLTLPAGTSTIGKSQRPSYQ